MERLLLFTMSPLMLAVLTGKNTAVSKLLLEHGAYVWARDIEGDTVFSCCLIQVCSSYGVFIIRQVQEKHLLDTLNNKGMTTLMQIMRSGNVSVVAPVL